MAIFGLRPADGTYSASEDGRTCLLNVDAGAYYGLNETGTMIWAAVVNREDLSMLISRLAAQYSQSRDAIESDVLHFVESLLRHGLLIDDS